MKASGARIQRPREWTRRGGKDKHRRGKTALGLVDHSRDSDVCPENNEKLLKDFKHGSDRTGTFENVPRDSIGRPVGAR